jgi:NDP-sugar pyrophosphorylase family protein
MGIYVFEPAILSYVGKRQHIDLPDLILQLLKNEKRPMAFESNCQWLDIGRFDDYNAALDIFEKHREQFLPGDKPTNGPSS